MRNPLALFFRTLPTGCYIPVSHKTNKQGYFRYRINGVLIMFHRIIWILNKGEIPKGYEINHKCNNRGCCNIEHLECISRKEHLALTNKLRYEAPSGITLKHLHDYRRNIRK